MKLFLLITVLSVILINMDFTTDHGRMKRRTAGISLLRGFFTEVEYFDTED